MNAIQRGIEKFAAIVFSALVIIALLTLIAGAAKCQDTYIGSGAKIHHTTNTDATNPGVYVEGALKLPKNFQARFLGDFSTESELGTLLTRDNNTERKATWETRFRPSLRYHSPFTFGTFKPFVEAGVDIYRQGFEGKGAECYGGDCGKSYAGYGSYRSGYFAPRLPKAGLNPFLGAGIRYKNYEAAYIRIFEDVGSWNISRLKGHRIGASYERPFYGPFSLKVAGEFDAVSFRESYGPYYDLYRERDNVFRVRVGFTFGKER